MPALRLAQERQVETQGVACTRWNDGLPELVAGRVENRPGTLQGGVVLGVTLEAFQLHLEYA